jgi:hypothetical protein
LQRYLSILAFIAILSVTGCATTDDLRRLRGDLNHQIQQTNDKVAGVELGSVGVKGEIAGLRKDIEKANEKTSEAFKPLRSGQAEGRADMTEIRDQIQQIRGSIDGLRKDLAAHAARTSRREEEDKALREKLDNVTFKLNFMENFLGIGKKDETVDATGEKNGKLPAATPPKDGAGKAKTDKESLYAAAYELFREAKYDKSSSSTPIRNFPTTPSSGSANVTTSRKNMKRRSSSTKRSRRISRRVTRFPMLF